MTLYDLCTQLIRGGSVMWQFQSAPGHENQHRPKPPPKYPQGRALRYVKKRRT